MQWVANANCYFRTKTYWLHALRRVRTLGSSPWPYHFAWLQDNLCQLNRLSITVLLTRLWNFSLNYTFDTFSNVFSCEVHRASSRHPCSPFNWRKFGYFSWNWPWSSVNSSIKIGNIDPGGFGSKLFSRHPIYRSVSRLLPADELHLMKSPNYLRNLKILSDESFRHFRGPLTRPEDRSVSRGIRPTISIMMLIWTRKWLWNCQTHKLQMNDHYLVFIFFEEVSRFKHSGSFGFLPKFQVAELACKTKVLKISKKFEVKNLDSRCSRI